MIENVILAEYFIGDGTDKIMARNSLVGLSRTVRHRIACACTPRKVKFISENEKKTETDQMSLGCEGRVNVFSTDSGVRYSKHLIFRSAPLSVSYYRV